MLQGLLFKVSNFGHLSVTTPSDRQQRWLNGKHSLGLRITHKDTGHTRRRPGYMDIDIRTCGHTDTYLLAGLRHRRGANLDDDTESPCS